MFDRDCPWIGSDWISDYGMTSEGGYECKVTHGVCHSSDYSKCVVYQTKEKLEEVGSSGGLEGSTDG